MTDATPSPDRARATGPAADLLAPLAPLLPATREGEVLAFTLALVALWAVAIAVFGIPALLWPMKLIVPALLIGLVALTWGM